MRPAGLEGGQLQQRGPETEGQYQPGHHGIADAHAPEQCPQGQQTEQEVHPAAHEQRLHLVFAEPIAGRVGVRKCQGMADGEPGRHGHCGACEVLVQRAGGRVAHVLPLVGLVAQVVAQEHGLQVGVIALGIATDGLLPAIAIIAPPGSEHADHRSGDQHQQDGEVGVEGTLQGHVLDRGVKMGSATGNRGIG